jgi:EAL domain-containing protein (putative c-di-GMP-specific phosphodiesterase class I)
MSDATGGREVVIGRTADTARVLVVDDDEMLRRSLARVLGAYGLQVEDARNGHEGLAQVVARDFDAVLCDVAMPDLSGIEFLRLVRSHDLELPVILMTGAPTVTTAAEAVEYGAFKYLPKPFDIQTMVAAVQHAVKLRRLARAKRSALELTSGAHATSLGQKLTRAIERLWIAYQPIVSTEGEIVAYEALMRTEEPALPNPAAMLDAAERLDQINTLGRAVRTRVVEPMEAAPHELLFVNIHPIELADEPSWEADTPLGRMASRVVLEVTERASLEGVKDLRARIARLRSIGYRIAIDDLGAGYAGLNSFACLEPDFVKLDISLVRGVDRSKTKQRVIQSMTSLCRDLGMGVVAEGIETATERDCLIELGCNYLQGYYFARPGRPFPSIRW